MDPIYIGVDFHARQQTICYLKIETGELVTSELKHQVVKGMRHSNAKVWLDWREGAIMIVLAVRAGLSGENHVTPRG